MKWIVFFMVIILIVLTVIPYCIVKWLKDDVPKEIEDAAKAKKVSLYMKNENSVTDIPLEYYIVGVVAAEMPAEFHKEALKAQAVAARTYAALRINRRQSGAFDEAHKDADVCSDYTHCQAWISKSDVYKRWGPIYSVWYWRKIMKAVYETWGEVITYKGELVDPVFHASSGGKTENCEEVWTGDTVPYLRSVVSEGEEVAPNFIHQAEIEKGKFISLIKAEYPEFRIGSNIMSEIKVLAYTTGGRVKDIKIGNVVLKGTEVRALFGLRSANFEIGYANGKIIFTTKGYGHGVGMSQWGANHLAANGRSYLDIIKHYYTGVEITKLD